MLQRRLAASLRLACALMDFSRNTIPTVTKLEPAKALNRSQPTTTDYLIVETTALGLTQNPFGSKVLSALRDYTSISNHSEIDTHRTACPIQHGLNSFVLRRCFETNFPSLIRWLNHNSVASDFIFSEYYSEVELSVIISNISSSITALEPRRPGTLADG